MDPIAIKFLMVILVTITIGTMLEKEKKNVKGFSWNAILLLTCCFLFEASTEAKAA